LPTPDNQGVVLALHSVCGSTINSTTRSAEQNRQ